MSSIPIDKILSDPLLIVAAVLLVVSPIVFLVAFVKYLRAPRGEDFAIPHHEMDSPIPARMAIEAPEEPARTLSVPQPEPEAPISALEPMPSPAAVAPAPVVPLAASAQPAFPTPPMRRADTASEKTVVMPPGMAEMQSEMEIAFSQLKLLNKRVASLEQELSRLRSGGPSEPSGNPQHGL
jgi:outer membrane biosynthesis protein TonB